VTGARSLGCELDASYWAKGIREPVQLSRAVGAAIADGHRLFVEVGPHPALAVELASDLPRVTARRWLSWAFGAAMGRWDVRIPLGARQVSATSDPFAPLPTFSPGMLPGWTPPEDYPLQVPGDGMLVDDPKHPWDVEARVHDVLKIIFGNAADTLESELCKAAGSKSLRDYFSSPSKYFARHIADYSKSKRKAPVFWLLRSQLGHYSVWLNWLRADGDTLFKVLGPALLQGRISRARQSMAELNPTGVDRISLPRTVQVKLSELDEVLLDLTEFEAALRRVTELKDERGQTVGWRPDFGDGALINAAPLHAVIAWKEPAKIWEELQVGAYPWSRTAARYWPSQITKALGADPSLRIAHGLPQEKNP